MMTGSDALRHFLIHIRVSSRLRSEYRCSAFDASGGAHPVSKRKFISYQPVRGAHLMN